MNTFQLECFLAVAEYLNFTRAASALHVTHPAISQQIKTLEEELNVQLFARTTRSVRITQEGRAFLPDAREMVEIANRAKHRFEVQGEKIEVLTIGVYNPVCMAKLTTPLSRLIKERPAVHPRLLSVPFQGIYQLLEDGRLDAIIGFKEERNFKFKGVFHETKCVPWVVIAHKDNPLAQKEKIFREDLKQEKLAIYGQSNAPVSILRMHGSLMEDRPPHDFYFSDNAEAINTLVASGIGISVLPEYFVKDIDTIVKIPFEEEPPMSFGIYYRTTKGNEALKTFIACLDDNQ